MSLLGKAIHSHQRVSTRAPDRPAGVGIEQRKSRRSVRCWMVGAFAAASFLTATHGAPAMAQALAEYQLLIAGIINTSNNDRISGLVAPRTGKSAATCNNSTTTVTQFFDSDGDLFQTSKSSGPKIHAALEPSGHDAKSSSKSPKNESSYYLAKVSVRTSPNCIPAADAFKDGRPYGLTAASVSPQAVRSRGLGFVFSDAIDGDPVAVNYLLVRTYNITNRECRNVASPFGSTATLRDETNSIVSEMHVGAGDVIVLGNLRVNATSFKAPTEEGSFSLSASPGCSAVIHYEFGDGLVRTHTLGDGGVFPQS